MENEKPKHPGGRPLKWNSLEEMQPLIDKYFNETPEDEWTICGFALALDTTRETILDYQEKDEFSDAIKRCKLRVQYSYEKSLKRRGNSGDIFALKNFGWRDDHNFNMGGQKNNPITVVDYSNMSTEQIARLVDAELHS